MRHPARTLIPLACFLAFVAVALSPGKSEPNSKDWAFVKDVLLGDELGIDVGSVEKWREPVVFHVSVGDGKTKRMTRRAIAEIDAALHGTGMGVGEGPSGSNVVIEFRPLRDLSKTKALHGCPNVPTYDAFACTWHENDQTTRRGVIAVRSDMPDEEIYSALVEEMVQTLGPRNDSTVFRDSLFYQDHLGFAPDWPKQFATRDKKLLRFLYLHLEPGDDAATVKAKFDRYWHDITVPD